MSSIALSGDDDETGVYLLVQGMHWVLALSPLLAFLSN